MVGIHLADMSEIRKVRLRGRDALKKPPGKVDRIAQLLFRLIARKLKPRSDKMGARRLVDQLAHRKRPDFGEFPCRKIVRIQNQQRHPWQPIGFCAFPGDDAPLPGQCAPGKNNVGEGIRKIAGLSLGRIDGVYLRRIQRKPRTGYEKTEAAAVERSLGSRVSLQRVHGLFDLHRILAYFERRRTPLVKSDGAGFGGRLILIHLDTRLSEAAVFRPGLKIGVTGLA